MTDAAPTQSPQAQTLHDFTMEEVLPHPPAAVWRALTESDLIGRWLMQNDFKPEVGAAFNFRAAPNPHWDGLVQCEVLEIEPERRLVYSWKGGKPPSHLDTVVSWTLTPTEAGTRVTMVQSGFRLPDNQGAWSAMSPGWGRMMQGLGRVAGEIG